MRHTAGRWTSQEKLEVKVILEPGETRTYTSDEVPGEAVEVTLELDLGKLRRYCTKALRSSSGRAVLGQGGIVIKGRLPKKEKAR